MGVRGTLCHDIPASLLTFTDTFMVAQEPNQSRKLEPQEPFCQEPSEPFFQEPKAEPEPPELFHKRPTIEKN